MELNQKKKKIKNKMGPLEASAYVLEQNIHLLVNPLLLYLCANLTQRGLFHKCMYAYKWKIWNCIHNSFCFEISDSAGAVY